MPAGSWGHMGCRGPHDVEDDDMSRGSAPAGLTYASRGQAEEGGCVPQCRCLSEVTVTQRVKCCEHEAQLGSTSGQQGRQERPGKGRTREQAHVLTAQRW